MRSRINIRRVLLETHVAQIHERRILLEMPPVRLGILLKYIKKNRIGGFRLPYSGSGRYS